MNALNPYGSIENSFYNDSFQNVDIANNRSQENTTKTPSRIPSNNPYQFQQKFVQGSENRLEKLRSVYDDKTLKRMGLVECATCAGRRYVDGSNDPGVSFKTPTHVSPEASVAAVTGHEMEHVSNEQANAKAEGGKVISQSVSIHMDICPECGVSYASGGLTKTTVSKPVQQPVKSDPGFLVDLKL